MSLPKPYYQEPGIVIYHADCREVLPYLPPVDLVLTDPPYGVRATRKSRLTMFLTDVIDTHWDDTSCDEFLLNSIISLGRSSIIWGGNCLSVPVSPCWLCWDKVNDDRNFSEFELAWTNLDFVPRTFRMRPQNMNGGKQHPTEKPLKLMRWCLSFAPNAKTMLDPFMGSGTTLRAAKDLGLSAIGIEIEEKYCAIAVERLRQEVLPLTPMTSEVMDADRDSR